MVATRITSSGIKHKKRWIRFSYGPDLSLHRYTEGISFANREQRFLKDLLKKMDEYSERSAKLRRSKKASQLRRVDRMAQNTLLQIGSQIFKILTRVQEIPVSSFNDLFGEALELTLVLDSTTRRFPWELAYDGQDFLCTRFDVGRKVENPRGTQRLSGYRPEYRKALVVGINYKWNPPETQLHTPEREGLLVSRRLRRKGYNVRLLRGIEATKSKIKRILSEGVSIFHFSGHGIYRTHQPEGSRGCLILNADVEKPQDAYFTEEDLRTCLDRAKGAPYLSFLNACQSGKEIYSSHLVDAFVDYGAEFVIGTFWPIYDEPSIKFSTRFYEEIVRNKSIAHALNLARWQFIGKRKLTEIATWPSFVLYGSPAHSLPRAP